MNLNKVRKVEDLRGEIKKLSDENRQGDDTQRTRMWSYATSAFETFFSKNSFKVTKSNDQTVATYGTVIIKLITLQNSNSYRTISITMPSEYRSAIVLNVELVSTRHSSKVPVEYSARDLDERLEQEISVLVEELKKLQDERKANIVPDLFFECTSSSGGSVESIFIAEKFKDEKFENFGDLLNALF